MNQADFSMRMPRTSRDRWEILFVLFIARTALAMQFQTIASLSSDLVRNFQIEYALIGTLIGLYMLPGVLLALPGGLIGQRFGAKRVAIAALALMLLGAVLAGIGDSFLALATGRLIAGTGAVLLNVMLTKMITDWFAEREIVTAMSILISSWPLGIGIGFLAFAPISEVLGWRWVMHISAISLLFSLCLIGMYYREPPGTAPASVRRLTLNLTRREWLLISLAGVIWGAHNVAFIVFVSFAPSHLVSQGISPVEANSLMSLTSWFLILTIPLSGYVAERWRMPNLFVIVGLIISVLTITAIVVTGETLVLLSILILVIGWPAGLIMALPAEVLRPEVRAVGMGVFYSWFYAVMAVLPSMAGAAQDMTGKPSAAVLSAAAFFSSTLILFLTFRAVQRIPAGNASGTTHQHPR